MNKHLLWIVALLALSCSTAKIQNSSPEQGGKSADISGTATITDSLSAGLVAWYPFNGNANDVSGHGFNGVVNGAILVADRFGHPNSAYSFNGWSDYITCGDILDSVFCAPVAAFSISGWSVTRLPGSRQGGGGCIIAKSGGGDAGPYQWSVTRLVGDAVYAAVFSEPTGTKQFIEKSNGPTALNQWFHFVFTFDGSLPEYDRLKIYINGLRSDEQTVRHQGTISTTTTETGAPVCIGSTMNFPALPSNFYNGVVDDIRIYNRAVSSTEVQMLYHEGGYYPAPSQALSLQSFTPARNALQVATTSPMTVTFNAAVNALTVNNTTVVVNGTISGRHESAFGYFGDTRIMRIAPKSPFRIGEVVTVTLTRGIMGTSGAPLARSYSWSFTVKTNSSSGVLALKSSIPLGNGSNPHSVVASDFDGDGKLDLAVANFDDRTVSIFRNNGNGAFTESSAVGVGDGPNCLIATDVDADGMADLVSTNFRGNTVTVLRNEGNGNFTPSTIGVGSQPVSVAAADFDGDGLIDLAVVNNASNTVSILKNRGRGAFALMSTIKVGSFPSSVVAADLNNDGFIDLAVTNSRDMEVSIFLNDGNGAFSLVRHVFVGNTPWNVAAADLNGDGNLDLAVTNNASGTVSILLNDGKANFTTGSYLNVGGTPSMVTAVDVNGDGFMDLAVGDNSRNTLSLWLNNGACSFTAGSVVKVDNYPCSAIAADLDGDGKLQVATANGSGNSVSILSSGLPESFSRRSESPTSGAGPLELKLLFTSPAGDRVLYGGEIGSIEIDIKNTGQKVARNVSAKVSVFPPTNDVRFTPVIPVGDVPANLTAKTGCSISASSNVKSLYLNIIVQIVADEGVVVPTKQMAITLKSRSIVDNKPPEIVLKSPSQISEAIVRGMRNGAVEASMATTASSLRVEGTARDNGSIVDLKINGSKPQMKTATGQIVEFTGVVPLVPGENHIEIVAIDNFRNQTSLKFTVHREGGSAAGQNYALLFAVEHYESWPHLLNPAPDAQAIADELKKSYGFRTELLQDVTRDDILTALRRYAEMKFNESDQLFIFFAGHGQFDPVLGDGYLVAKDSRLNDDIKTSYVAHSVLRTIVNNIPCRHIFLVVDACFGGTIDPLIAANSRGDDTYTEVSKTEFIQRKLQFKTRRFLTSGGKEYVPDGRPGEHSPFVRKFLEALRSYGGNDGILTINKILQYEEKVTPQPRAGEFGANEPGSDFIFIAR